MTEQIPVETFRAAVLVTFEEIFEQVHQYMLDPGTSLLETLADVSAEEASRRVSPSGACLAAQVNHISFYIEGLASGLAGGPPLDWASSWAIESVTDEEWRVQIERLRTNYQYIRDFVSTWTEWDARFVGGAIGLAAHCAYHLGEIRAGLGVVRGKAAA